MFCPNCGNDCGDARFCPSCGTKLMHNGSALENESFKDVMMRCDELLGEEFESIMQKHSPESKEDRVADHQDTPAIDEELFKGFQKAEQENVSFEQEMKKRRPYTSAFRQYRAQVGLSDEIVCPQCGSNNVSTYKRDEYWSNIFLYTRPARSFIVIVLIRKISEYIRTRFFYPECICLNCEKIWYPKKNRK